MEVLCEMNFLIGSGLLHWSPFVQCQSQCEALRWDTTWALQCQGPPMSPQCCLTSSATCSSAQGLPGLFLSGGTCAGDWSGGLACTLTPVLSLWPPISISFVAWELGLLTKISLALGGTTPCSVQVLFLTSSGAGDHLGFQESNQVDCVQGEHLSSCSICPAYDFLLLMSSVSSPCSGGKTNP